MWLCSSLVQIPLDVHTNGVGSPRGVLWFVRVCVLCGEAYQTIVVHLGVLYT